MKRKIITIDEDKCNGCGLCIPNCPEGAIQMIDGKARLISDIFCDGLGACIGHCPDGAIQTEEREAEPYDESKVIPHIVRQGTNTLIAHLKHLNDHGEMRYLNQALDYLRKKNIPAPKYEAEGRRPGCPGAKQMSFSNKTAGASSPKSEPGKSEAMDSELTQWPVQLTLLNPGASYLNGADLVIAADCVPFAFPDFHAKFLKGRKLAIFCPKLDQNMDEYMEKLTEIFKTQSINSVRVVRMEVPCCGGVTMAVRQALEASGASIPFSEIVISIQGKIISPSNPG